jgi:flavin reductase (DIM6/NTAB) family NADH-FMN oxidoreductase RutF
MSAPEHDMRTIMGHFATGVCVISTQRGDGEPVATTVNAVTSVSLEPPLLLVCLAHDSETLAAVESCGRFAVNVLAESQREHSIRFAAKGERARALEVEFGEHQPGIPYLPDALVAIACRVSAMHRGGDHMIVIGEVVSTSSAESEDTPLLFFRGSYSRLQRERTTTPRRRPGRRRIAVLERIG